MTPFEAIILGIVEGVTEYLPVSSTGHLILVSRWLGLVTSEESRKSIDTFNIVVQGAAVLAVAGLYRRDVLAMIRALLVACKLMRPVPMYWRHLQLARNLFLSFIPAAIIGLLLDDWFESRFFAPVPVLGALALGGVVIIAIAPWVRARARDTRGVGRDGATLTIPVALGIGLLQCVALFPGTSRSMMTILGGLMGGMSPRDAAKYSFLLALPTLGSACLYKSYGLWKSGGMLEQLGGWMPFSLGMVAAFISAALSVQWLIGYLGKGGIAIFGWWRVGLAAVLFVGIWQGWVKL
ncbi:MAG: undecaprenyl-diphosphate phosphatase [Phycisphaerales bacterium]|nr:undecaprenyl-diphosphate phosphatase [Phycisphaerales bacterium]